MLTLFHIMMNDPELKRMPTDLGLALDLYRREQIKAARRTTRKIQPVFKATIGEDRPDTLISIFKDLAKGIVNRATYCVQKPTSDACGVHDSVRRNLYRALEIDAHQRELDPKDIPALRQNNINHLLTYAENRLYQMELQRNRNREGPGNDL